MTIDEVIVIYYDDFEAVDKLVLVGPKARHTIQTYYTQHTDTINTILRALRKAFADKLVVMSEDYQAPEFLLCLPEKRFVVDYACMIQIVGENHNIYVTFWVVFKNNKMFLDFGYFADEEIKNKVFETLRSVVKLEKVFEHRWGIEIYRIINLR